MDELWIGSSDDDQADILFTDEDTEDDEGPEENNYKYYGEERSAESLSKGQQMYGFH